MAAEGKAIIFTAVIYLFIILFRQHK